MKGRIQTFYDEKGFGFIIGVDNESYFFHVSEIKSFEQPSVGKMVEFEPSQNEKGKCAINVKINSSIDMPIFVTFGNDRLKINNIKNYGISSDIKFFQKVYRRTLAKRKEGFFGWLFSDKYSYNIDSKIEYEISSWEFYNIDHIEPHPRMLVYFNKGDIINDWAPDKKVTSDGIYPSTSFADSSDVYKKNVDYLYVTTFQNDNYKYFQNSCSWDIYEKLNELDTYFK